MIGHISGNSNRAGRRLTSVPALENNPIVVLGRLSGAVPRRDMLMVRVGDGAPDRAEHKPFLKSCCLSWGLNPGLLLISV